MPTSNNARTTPLQMAEQKNFYQKNNQEIYQEAHHPNLGNQAIFSQSGGGSIRQDSNKPRICKTTSAATSNCNYNSQILHVQPDATKNDGNLSVSVSASHSKNSFTSLVQSDFDELFANAGNTTLKSGDPEFDDTCVLIPSVSGHTLAPSTCGSRSNSRRSSRSTCRIQNPECSSISTVINTNRTDVCLLTPGKNPMIPQLNLPENSSLCASMAPSPRISSCTVTPYYNRKNSLCHVVVNELTPKHGYQPNNVQHNMIQGNYDTFTPKKSIGQVSSYTTQSQHSNCISQNGSNLTSSSLRPTFRGTTCTSSSQALLDYEINQTPLPPSRSSLDNIPILAVQAFETQIYRRRNYKFYKDIDFYIWIGKFTFLVMIIMLFYFYYYFTMMLVAFIAFILYHFFGKRKSGYGFFSQ